MTRLELLEVAKPIPFFIEMVLAIQNNEKTVTRRKVKPQPPKEANGIYERMDNGNFQMKVAPYENIYDYEIIPPYQVGDYLYVQEPYAINNITPHDPDWLHKADYDCTKPPYCNWKWCPSARMPKEAARIFLRVTDVQAKRLQNITECGLKAALKEARAEGFSSRAEFISAITKMYPNCSAESWFWVIEFEKVEVE